MAKKEKPKPWERQPGESAPAYAAFCVFRDADVPRVKLDAYRQRYGKTTAKCPPGWFSKWTKKFKWVNRAKKYDAHMGKIEQLEREKLRKKDATNWDEVQQQHRDEMLVTGRELIDKGKMVLKIPLFDTVIVEGKDGKEVHLHPLKGVTLGDAVRAIAQGDKTVRAAAEMEAKVIVVHYDIDFAALTPEQVVRIAAGERPDEVAPEHVQVH